jgi:hypothetical protein
MSNPYAIGSIIILKRDSLTLLNSLMRCLSDGFILIIGHGEKFLLKFRQGVKKQPKQSRDSSMGI